MKGKARFGLAVGLTLVNLQEWAAAIQTDPEIEIEPSRKSKSPARSDSIVTIADRLIQQDAKGIERQLLSKSLQETLFYCTGFNLEAGPLQIRQAVREFLLQRQQLWITERFLAMHFFNFVWYQTSESFRTAARTSSAFEEDMQAVDELCQKAVAGVLRTLEGLKPPLDATTAHKIVKAIEENLRGEP